MEQKQKLPDFLKIYFWDIDIDQLDVEENYYIILERLLNYADDRALKWLLNTYNRKKIKEVVKNSRRLNAKTANFWQKHLNMRKEEMRCFQKPYLRKDKKSDPFWNY